MSLLDYFNDRTGAREVAHGSDGRINVSSRADPRVYYNSRDKKKTYILPFDDAAASAGDDVCVLFNNDVTDKLVIHKIVVNALAVASFKVKTVTGTAGGGAVSATPVNLHLGGEDAVVTASTVANSDSSPITGLADADDLSHDSVVVSGKTTIAFSDALRLEKGNGISIEKDSGASTRVFGYIIFFFEKD